MTDVAEMEALRTAYARWQATRAAWVALPWDRRTHTPEQHSYVEAETALRMLIPSVTELAAVDGVMLVVRHDYDRGTDRYDSYIEAVPFDEIPGLDHIAGPTPDVAPIWWRSYSTAKPDATS